MKKVILDWIWRNGDGGTGTGLSYTSLPTAPAFSDTFLLDHTDVLNSVETTEISGKKDLLVKNPFSDRLRPNNFQGTAISPYRIKSESDSIRTWVGGDVVTTAQQISGMLNSPTYVYFYHLGFVGNSDPVTQTGITACQPTASATGSNFIYDDIVIKDVSFAGIQVNSSTGSVANITISFLRVFGHNLDGEGFYIGNTSKVTYAIITNSTVSNCLVTDKGRDGMQFNNNANLYVNKCTVYDVGKANIASQKSLIQVQNTNGLIENCVFCGAPEFGTIGTHGVTFRNCVFYADARGYINRMTTDYTGSPMETNADIVFENCHFGASAAIAEAWRVQEDECNVSFINCTKDSNITNLYLDFRTDLITYTLSETGTTTAASVTPTFNNLDPDDDTHGLIQEAFYRSNGIGYRN